MERTSEWQKKTDSKLLLLQASNNTQVGNALSARRTYIRSCQLNQLALNASIRNCYIRSTGQYMEQENVARRCHLVPARPTNCSAAVKQCCYRCTAFVLLLLSCCRQSYSVYTSIPLRQAKTGQRFHNSRTRGRYDYINKYFVKQSQPVHIYDMRELSFIFTLAARSIFLSLFSSLPSSSSSSLSLSLKSLSNLSGSSGGWLGEGWAGDRCRR